MTIAIFILCLLIMLLVGALHRGPTGDFLLAGQRAGAFTVGTSLTATCLGGSAVLGMAERAYEIGWGAFWWLGAGAIGLACLAFFYAHIFQSDRNCVTLPEWLGNRTGNCNRRISAILIAVMWIGVIAAQWVAAGAVIKNTIGTSQTTGVIATAAIVALYTCIGGQSAVLKTDKLQTLFIFMAIALPAVMLINQHTSVPFKTLPRVDSAQTFTIWQWIAMTFVVGGMYAVGPDMFSRVRTAANARAARKGAMLGAAGLALAAVILTTLGVMAHGTVPAETAAKDVLPVLINTLIPAPLAALLQAGIMAALMSSADTCLLTAASVTGRDFNFGTHNPETERLHIRLLIIAAAALSACVAIVNPKIIGNIMIAYAAFAGGLLAPLTLLPFSKRSKDSMAAPVCAAILTGATASAVMFIAHIGYSREFTMRTGVAGMTGAIISAIVFTCWPSNRKTA